MAGNVPALYNPATVMNRQNTYPSAFFTDKYNNVVPSINGRNLYVPLCSWFCNSPKLALPLVALQKAELSITITLAPIQNLFQIRDVFDPAGDYPFVRPDFKRKEMQPYLFLQSPILNISDSPETNYPNTLNTWDCQVRLLANFCFLTVEEAASFAAETQTYLIRDVTQYLFPHISETARVRLNASTGMVTTWMWFLRRTDAATRNEWSNYSNWPYASNNLIPTSLDLQIFEPNFQLQITPPVADASMQEKNILLSTTILLGGEPRENELDRDVFNYIEKYSRTGGQGTSVQGLFCYNFCLDATQQNYQPTGAVNMSKFNTVAMDIVTIRPPQNTSESANIRVFCGNTITAKQIYNLFEYTFDLVLFEESYNLLIFQGGVCALKYAK